MRKTKLWRDLTIEEKFDAVLSLAEDLRDLLRELENQVEAKLNAEHAERGENVE